MVWYETKEGELINLDRFDRIEMYAIKGNFYIDAERFISDSFEDNIDVTLFTGTKEECEEELERIKKMMAGCKR